MQAHVTPFFHASTSTWSYLVRDPASGEAAVIDAPLDFDQASGEVGHASAAAILEAAARDGARVRWILETHAHADHLSAAAWLKERTGAPTAIGAGIVQVQDTFRRKLGLDEDEPHLDAGAFDRLLHDGAEVPLAEQRACNRHIREGVEEADFVAMRRQRDAGLPPPRLLWPALQVNIRGGRLPPAEANGQRYLKLPLQLRGA